MESLPQAVVVLDVKEDKLVVNEAKKVKIPIAGIVDTNTDPTPIDYPIPGNDDALSSLQYILGIIVKTIMEEKKAKKTVSDKAVRENLAQRQRLRERNLQTQRPAFA